VVETPGGTAFDAIDVDTLEGWVRAHRVVVLRGLAPLEKAELPGAARRLGPLQAWSFGSVHELVPDPKAVNYLYTRREVPLHWDGAFAGRVPHYLVFHCVEAPGADAGGATTFVDTTRVWDRADAATRDRWRALRFTYSTDRVAHYGGRFTQKLVAQHPTDGGAVLRFAEPVDDLNPVHVEAMGLDPLTSARVITELREALYADDVLLEHAWQPNDVVIADNHALLHGRRAFTRDAPRHLRRVNVHDRRRSWRDAIVDSIRIRRPEFVVAEIPILLIAALAATNGAWSALASSTFIAAAALFFLLFHFGDMINCLADRDLDAVYKTALSEAVYGLGLRNVKTQIALTVLGALALSVGLALTLDRVAIVLLVVMGLALGAQYSLRPLWLKGRGLAQVVTLWLVIFVGPMLLIASAMGEVTLLGALLFALYGAMQQGIVLINTAEDLPEDRASGIRTSAIALGLRGAVWTALGLVLLGGAGVIALTFVSGARFALVPLALAFTWVLIELAVLGLRVSRAPNERAALSRLRPAARRMPLWITATAWTSLLAVGAAS
jgi:alpha-ketoglutarate-dependent taurine dioxygenase/4-hydroxybenzoate polyprenyltransferase